MAAYIDLRSLVQSADGNILRKRVEVAVSIAAQAYLAGTPTAEEKAWALGVLTDPQPEAVKILAYLISENADSTLAQITGVSDSALQTLVDAAAAKVI